METRSTCPYCGVGCGVVIEHDEGRITGVRGDPDHPANFGQLCTKGRTLHLTAAPQAMVARLSHPLRRLARQHSTCEAGQAWTWDGVRFDVLHPQAGDAARERRPNPLSCVLRIAAPDGTSALLTGDIEATQEAALVQRLGEGLRSQVLLVPQHGETII